MKRARKSGKLSLSHLEEGTCYESAVHVRNDIWAKWWEKLLNSLATHHALLLHNT